MKRLGLAGLALATALAGCSGSDAVDGEPLVVSAAASLADAFAELEGRFETDNPGVDVVLNMAGSAAVREQILDGAPVDVVATASRQTMEPLVTAGAVEAPQVFAANAMTIAVPAGNPGGVSDLADFARTDLLIGLCDAGVPCGDLARQALLNAGVVPEIDTNEPNVRALLTKLVAGELDAGITYLTDIAAGGDDILGIEIGSDHNVANEYVIATVVGTGHAATAAEFVSFVLSVEGQEILAAFGFGRP